MAACTFGSHAGPVVDASVVAPPAPVGDEDVAGAGVGAGDGGDGAGDADDGAADVDEGARGAEDGAAGEAAAIGDDGATGGVVFVTAPIGDDRPAAIGPDGCPVPAVGAEAEASSAAGTRRSTRSSRPGCVMIATAKSAMPRITTRTALTTMALRVLGSRSAAGAAGAATTGCRAGVDVAPSR